MNAARERVAAEDSEDFEAFRQRVVDNNKALAHLLSEHALDALVTFDARITGAVGQEAVSLLYYVFAHYCSRKQNEPHLLFEEIAAGGNTMEVPEFILMVQQMLPQAATVLSTADIIFILHHTKAHSVPVPWQPRWGAAGDGNHTDVKFDEWLCALVRIAVVAYGPHRQPPSSHQTDSHTTEGASGTRHKHHDPPAPCPAPPLPAASGVLPLPTGPAQTNQASGFSGLDCVTALAVDMGLGCNKRAMHAKLLTQHRMSKVYARCMRTIYTVHALCTHCVRTVHALCTHCVRTVYALCT